jgi:hypothetical protein
MGPPVALKLSKPGLGPKKNKCSLSNSFCEKEINAPRAPPIEILSVPGFNEYRPQYAAGMRKLPPISLPIPRGEPSMAMSAPSPPELPPHVYRLLYGLVVRPQSGLQHSKANIVCGTFVLTKGTAPASRRVSTSYWFISQIQHKHTRTLTSALVLAGFIAQRVNPIEVSNPMISTIHDGGKDYMHAFNDELLTLVF